MKHMEQLGQEYQDNKVKIDKAIQRVLSSGRYILGDEVKKFEKRFAEYMGSKHCVGVGSGFGALYISLMVASVPGAKVSILNELHSSTTSAVMLSGGVKQERADKTTDILIPVWKEGIEYPIKALCDKHVVIEDACQSMGMMVDGKRPGTFGIAGCFSFHPLKPLHCYGDGGAILTDNKDFAEDCKVFRNHGRKGERYGFGINSRLDEIQAAVLNEFLK